MSVVFKTVSVSKEDILDAMSKFDKQHANPQDYDHWFRKGNYKHAVKHGERYYPVKHILSKATKIESSSFSGGDQANAVFRKLGFQIVPKPSQPPV